MTASEIISRLHLTFPGAWSPRLFERDLAENKYAPELLAPMISRMVTQKSSYLEFYRELFGVNYPGLDKRKEKIFKIFEAGSLMLYFESLFLQLLESPLPHEEILFEYLLVMGNIPPYRWDEVVQLIGACCYQFFAKEPHLYPPLLYRKKADTPEEMTDRELLGLLKMELEPVRRPGLISIHDSRSSLIKLYTELM